MNNTSRVGYDEERGLTFVHRHPLAMSSPVDEPERCPTCGRAFDCRCEEPYKYGQGTTLTRSGLDSVLGDMGMEEVVTW